MYENISLDIVWDISVSRGNDNCQSVFSLQYPGPHYCLTGFACISEPPAYLTNICGKGELGTSIQSCVFPTDVSRGGILVYSTFYLLESMWQCIHIQTHPYRPYQLLERKRLTHTTTCLSLKPKCWFLPHRSHSFIDNHILSMSRLSPDLLRTLFKLEMEDFP